jgi:hypothetical protein
MEEATQGSLMHGLKPKPLELVGFSVCQLFCVNDQVLFLGMGARGKG